MISIYWDAGALPDHKCETNKHQKYAGMIPCYGSDFHLFNSVDAHKAAGFGSSGSGGNQYTDLRVFAEIGTSTPAIFSAVFNRLYVAEMTVTYLRGQRQGEQGGVKGNEVDCLILKMKDCILTGCKVNATVAPRTDGLPDYLEVTISATSYSIEGKDGASGKKQAIIDLKVNK